MKNLFVAVLCLTSLQAFSCDFQGEQSEYIRGDIECNEVAKTALVKNPEILIDDEYHNIMLKWQTSHEYWDTKTTKVSSSKKRETVVTESRKTGWKVHNISSKSMHKICKMFGFKKAIELKGKAFYSYFHDAYSIDHDELFTQSSRLQPIGTVKCK